MKATVNKGKIQFDLDELIDELDPETKKKIISIFAWESPVWEEMKRQLSEEYASRSTNSKVYEMRLALFQSENAPEALRQTIGALLDTIKHLQAKERAESIANGKWRMWYHENMPAHRQPVPFPKYEIEWALDRDVREFLECNGLADILQTEEQS